MGKTELKEAKEILEMKTEHFEEEIRKLKTNLKSSEETFQVQTVHFNGELRKVKTELRQSKTSLDQLQRKNAWLKENLENASKIQDNFISKIEDLAQSNSQEIEKVVVELKASKEMLLLKNDDLNEQIENVKTASQSSQRKLQASLDKVQRENVLLTRNLETASENLENVSSRLQSVAQSTSKEPIFFDYTLGDHMTSTGKWEIIKFDRPEAVSATKIYDESTGIVTIEEDGLYYFYAHGLPYEKSDSFWFNIYVDDEMACRAYKDDGTDAHMSCAIVRHLKRGQTIYVIKYNKLLGAGSSYPNTGFLGFKLQ